MKISIKNRYTDAVIFEAEADSFAVALVMAVKRNVQLYQADISNQNLNYINLDGATFVGATFVGATFDGATFVGARFDGATFVGATFDEDTAQSLGAAWFSAKADLWMTLLLAPMEAPGLLAALREGRVDGSKYTGECACLVGTLANVRGCDYHDFRPDANRPSERWFAAIKKGHTPDNHPISKITVEWVEEWHRLFLKGVHLASVAA